LVQAVAPAAAGEHAARELVDDQDLVVFDHVVLVAFVEGVRTEQLIQDVQLLHVDRSYRFLTAIIFCTVSDALVGQGCAEALSSTL